MKILPAPFIFLALAGAVMVYTLWTSKKARNVIETEQNLSRQGEGSEKYNANTLSRGIVRGAMYVGNGINFILPKSIQFKIDQQFILPEYKGKRSEQPMFDMVRASVNLMVAQYFDFYWNIFEITSFYNLCDFYGCNGYIFC